MHLRSTIFLILVLVILSSPSLRADSMSSSVDKTSPKISTNMGNGQKATGVDSRTRYISLINEWAPQYNLDANLVEAVVAVESNFDRFAVSKKGAQGLMQLIPATAKRFGVRDVFDAADNIRGGIRYLNFLMELFSREPGARPRRLQCRRKNGGSLSRSASLSGNSKIYPQSHESVPCSEFSSGSGPRQVATRQVSTQTHHPAQR